MDGRHSRGCGHSEGKLGGMGKGKGKGRSGGERRERITEGREGAEARTHGRVFIWHCRRMWTVRVALDQCHDTNLASGQ